MKTSRTLLCGYSKSFGFFVLFAMGSIVASTMASEESSTVGSLSVTHAAANEQKENAKITPSPGKHSEISVASPEGSNPPAEPTSNTFGRKDTKVTSKQIRAVTKSSEGKKTSNETTATNSDFGDDGCFSDACPLGMNSLIIILLLSLRI